MLILFGKKLDSSKTVRYALKDIFGIGISSSTKICNALNIPLKAEASDLTDFQQIIISSYIKNHYFVEAKLKQQIHENIENLKTINCVKGFRHRYKLPVRGQRTRSNAQTCKKLLK